MVFGASTQIFFMIYHIIMIYHDLCFPWIRTLWPWPVTVDLVRQVVSGLWNRQNLQQRISGSTGGPASAMFLPLGRPKMAVVSLVERNPSII